MKSIGLFLTAIFFMIPQLSSQEVSLPDTLIIGKHTVSEWRYIVDTTWGDGLPTEDKLLLFDRYWEAVDKYYPGFVNLSLDWDSVRNHYRPIIENGVSHGRFAGIITKMGFLLNESHTGAINFDVFLTKPEPGVPIVVNSFYKTNDTTAQDHGHFGAVLTPMNDDQLLVLRAVDNHPLGIEAGDIVFGYDSKPWKELYPLLVAMDFPITSNSLIEGWFQGGADVSSHHKWLASAGLNWHLFDTLDFQKFGSSDTLHRPTSLLADKSYSIFANEQLPVESLEFPGSIKYAEYDWYNLKPVIYGELANDSIGYMYLTHTLIDNNDLFKETLDSILNSNLKGLIFDLRYHVGGDAFLEDFNPIFGNDFHPFDFSIRSPDGSHSDLEGIGYSWWPALDTSFLDIPIALLTGPGARSMGDYTSYLIHIQPNSRSFGRRTSSSFTHIDCANDKTNDTATFNNGCLFWDFGYEGWVFAIAPRNFTLYHGDEPDYMIHKGFAVDEEIWFTQEAAFLQKDNIVERAIEWIDSIASTVEKVETLSSPALLTVYPNPVKDLLTVESSYIGSKTLKVLDLSGRLLHSEYFVGPSCQLDLSSLKKGVCFITISSKDFMTTKKIIKL